MVRDGEVLELTADEVVPGDVVEVGPGDQLVADGEVIASRGMTMDESLLTGESDGIQKGEGDRVLSGSFCVSGSGHYVVDAVREQSYAGRSPARQDLPPPALAAAGGGQPGDHRLHLRDGAAGGRPRAQPQGPQRPLDEAAQTATAGLVTLIPEGLVLLMSVTFAVAAKRLARRGTLVQQMSATESLASVDSICVDKTGTLTAASCSWRGSSTPTGSTRSRAPRRWDGSPPAPATATRPWRR